MSTATKTKAAASSIVAKIKADAHIFTTAGSFVLATAVPVFHLPITSTEQTWLRVAIAGAGLLSLFVIPSKGDSSATVVKDLTTDATDVAKVVEQVAPKTTADVSSAATTVAADTTAAASTVTASEVVAPADAAK